MAQTRSLGDSSVTLFFRLLGKESHPLLQLSALHVTHRAEYSWQRDKLFMLICSPNDNRASITIIYQWILLHLHLDPSRVWLFVWKNERFNNSTHSLNLAQKLWTFYGAFVAFRGFCSWANAVTKNRCYMEKSVILWDNKWQYFHVILFLKCLGFGCVLLLFSYLQKAMTENIVWPIACRHCA